ncbi:rRNA maturation RNase YbeY [Hirschia maritima]|uniref:rRNA maturation RNase YbeY n=1 Tax=Hirschia maritima TaxID=1121961 RepID=UPI0003732C75|nr:rRNA maturation RNase YbeY [Hirschia maritima]
MIDTPTVLTIDLRIEDENWTSALVDCEKVIESALEAAAQKMNQSGLVEVLLTNDAEMRELNSKWRGKDTPTDVLSFPSEGADMPGMQTFLGDLALGLEVAKTDADKLGRDFELHVMHLLVHGFLHLLGYDHMSEEEAKHMEGLEAQILAPLGLPDPYGDAA